LGENHFSPIASKLLFCQRSKVFCAKLKATPKTALLYLISCQGKKRTLTVQLERIHSKEVEKRKQ